MEEIKTIYQECLITGEIPTTWQQARVVFIPKPGKDDYTDPGSFRPISLTSFFLKGLERIVLWYIEKETGQKNLWSKNVYAYRQKRSTETALHHAKIGRAHV